MTRPVLLRMLLLAALAASAGAYAHEGHDDHDDDQPAPATAAVVPHATADASRIELVAERRGPDVLLYVDDFATNAPLGGLQVSVHSGAQVLQAAAAGEGVYRVPGDLISAEAAQALEVDVQGKGITAQVQTTLPVAAPGSSTPTRGLAPPTKPWLLAGAGLLVLLVIAWAASRLKRSGLA